MNKPTHTLAAAWASFDLECMSPNISSVQCKEARRAFYAGARSLLDIISTVMDPIEEATSADMVRIYDLASELMQFEVDVQDGKA